MAKKHAERTHDQWSASATERNWLCPGNIALAMDTVQMPESRAAAWGTACHQIAERLLKGETVELGDMIETERFVFPVDEEFLNVAGVYVGYIRKRCEQGFDLYAVEQKFDLTSLLDAGGVEAGGTVDAMLYNPNTETLEVVDMKTGKGKYVEAKGNPQERFYALGGLLDMDMDPTPVSTVITTIVQPRYQGGEPIRSETLDIVELMDWTIDLGEKMRTATAALKLYGDVKESAIRLEAWVDMYLNPGEVQCPFCPAAGSCPALRRNALAIIGAYEDDGGTHFKSNRFEDNTIEGVEADLDMLDQIESWIRERRALAHEMAAQGMKFDHHVLVEKIGNRKFRLKDEELVGEIRKRIAVSDEQLFDTRVKSPAGLERSVGKGTVEFFLGDLIERPITGTDLIRSTHTTRTAAQTLTDFLVDIPVETYDGPSK